MDAPVTTPWFPVGTNPVRAGWYEVMFDISQRHAPVPAMCFWNGKRWFVDASCTRIAYVGVDGFQDHWRGLACEAATR